MQYIIRDDSVIQIQETFGTIQNASSCAVEISNSADFTDVFMLRGWQELRFIAQLYIRAKDVVTAPIKVNVVPFASSGGGGDGISAADLQALQAQFQAQFDQFNDQINHSYCCIADDHAVTIKPHYNNLPRQVIISGLQDTDKVSTQLMSPDINIATGAVDLDTPVTICNSVDATVTFNDSSAHVILDTKNLIFNKNKGSNIIAVTGGDNTINGWTADDTLKFEDCEPTLAQYSSDTFNGFLIQFSDGSNVILKGNLNTAPNLIHTISTETLTATANADVVTLSTGVYGEYLLTFADSSVRKSNVFDSKVVVSLGAGDDTLTINDKIENVTILPGAGNDSIVNLGKNNTFYFDSISSSNKTIDGFKQHSDTILINPSTVVDSSSNGSDTSLTLSKGSTVANILLKNISDGTLHLAFNNVLDLNYVIGSGQFPQTVQFDNTVDSFTNVAPLVSITGSANDNFLINHGAGAYISVHAGNGTIINSADFVSVIGGAGNNSIINQGAKVSISGAGGNDTVQNTGDFVTIYGGAGNDSISNTGKHVIYQFANANGTNTVKGFNQETDNIWFSGVAKESLISAASLSADNKEIKITGGTGSNLTTVILQPPNSDTFKLGTPLDVLFTGNFNSSLKSVAPTKILDATNAPIVYNNKNSKSDYDGGIISLIGGNGGKIDNYADNVKIYANATTVDVDSSTGVGNVITIYGDGVTLYGSSKADLINIAGDNCSISSVNGGNDTIYVYEGANNNTIAGGAGNDLIVNNSTKGNIFRYIGAASVEGADTITNWNANDTLYVSTANTTIKGAYNSRDKYVISLYHKTSVKSSLEFQNDIPNGYEFKVRKGTAQGGITVQEGKTVTWAAGSWD